MSTAAFVSVSRTPHMPKILKDIISRVGYCVSEMEDDVQRLIEILRERLANQRYLIIIDDLSRITDWHIIKCAFVENNNASRVITTTGIQDVATASCIPSQGHVYQMQPLNELHSRRLFFKRLFDTEDTCPEQFREISDQMLRKCKWVPLAITSIASLLAIHMHIEIWEKIHNSLGSELDTNPTLEWMRHVLSLSYNDLSHELKTCLLYLGIYPEDYEIDKSDLVRKWIAEGFIREKHGLDLEEAAENCFNELINRNMIQPGSRLYDFGEVLYCQVHDLMLDLIILKCKEENFITIIDKKKYPMNGAQVRRISQQLHDRDTAEYECIKVLKFELLRVLEVDATNYSYDTLFDLSAINHLFLLKYLKVRGPVKLPKKFGNLKQLMTLHTSRISSRSSSDFSSLTSLRHLITPEEVIFKNGLGKLCNLRHLSSFGIGRNHNSIECIRDLGELTNLRSLKVIFFPDDELPDGVENNPETILAASLIKPLNSNLRSLTVCMGTSAQSWSNCLARPRHLERFELWGESMPKLPNWFVCADRLAYAVIGVQELRLDDVQVLGQLPCLIYLLLGARTIPEKSIIIHPNTFHSLKSFQFITRDELARLTFEPASMPRLQRLVIQLDARVQGAMELQEAINSIKHLASLEEISLEILAKCGQRSKVESACRDAISRHPKSQAMKADVICDLHDESGKFLNIFYIDVVGTSGED